MAKRRFTKYPSGYVRANDNYRKPQRKVTASAWYEPDDPDWTIEDERSPYFDLSRYNKWTADDWAYYIASELGLEYYEYNDLLSDLNNLRGYEWVENVEGVLDDDKLLAFKRFVHYYDDEQDNFYGYEEDEL